VRKASFAPVVDGQVRVLVLGSLPGEASLARGQYYAHPQNRFWMLMSEVTGTALAEREYAERLQVLLRHRIGLWDVVADAHRIGSLDGSIRGHVGNDLVGLVGSLPQLAVIAFNGGTAARIGSKSLGDAAGRYRVLRLPSSSPAYTLPYRDKLAAWRVLRDWVGPGVAARAPGPRPGG
jgi:hypoxanthine-DNA glycosylase